MVAEKPLASIAIECRLPANSGRSMQKTHRRKAAAHKRSAYVKAWINPERNPL